MTPRFKSTIQSSGQLCSVCQNKMKLLILLETLSYWLSNTGLTLSYIKVGGWNIFLIYKIHSECFWKFWFNHIQKSNWWGLRVVSSGVGWWTPHVTGRITTESWCLSGQTLGLRRDSSGQRWECRAFSDQVWLCITDLLWTSFSFLKRSRRSPKKKPKVRF